MAALTLFKSPVTATITSFRILANSLLPPPLEGIAYDTKVNQVETTNIYGKLIFGILIIRILLTKLDATKILYD